MTVSIRISVNDGKEVECYRGKYAAQYIRDLYDKAHNSPEGDLCYINIFIEKVSDDYFELLDEEEE